MSGTALGVVARLQVQRGRLKPGPPLGRVYDPSPVAEVAALEIGPRGCRGLLDGSWVLDVHHADHPESRNNALRNGLSVLPRTHQEQLVAAHGPHLAGGAVGDSVLLDTGGPLALEDLSGTLVLETADGPVELGDAMVAAPCVEFARYVLRRPPGPVGDEERAALRALDDGARGFYLTPRSTAVVRVGDRLLRP